MYYILNSFSYQIPVPASQGDGTVVLSFVSFSLGEEKTTIVGPALHSYTVSSHFQSS